MNSFGKSLLGHVGLILAALAGTALAADARFLSYASG
jgi:hypothetical protein